MINKRKLRDLPAKQREFVSAKYPNHKDRKFYVIYTFLLFVFVFVFFFLWPLNPTRLYSETDRKLAPSIFLLHLLQNPQNPSFISTQVLIEEGKKNFFFRFFVFCFNLNSMEHDGWSFGGLSAASSRSTYHHHHHQSTLKSHSGWFI